MMLSFKLYEFATRSLESLLQNFWGILCHRNLLTLNFSLLTNQFWMLFPIDFLIWPCFVVTSFCWRIILSCNAKQGAIKFSLLIFSNCPLVRICGTTIIQSYLRHKHTPIQLGGQSGRSKTHCMAKPNIPEMQNANKANVNATKTMEEASLRFPGDTATH